MRLRFAPLALLFVAAMWGATFTMMKDVIKRQDVTSFLFTRFLLAFLTMLILRPTIMKFLTKDLLLRGFIAGCFLGAGFIFQTLGLSKSTAAITGFITGLYVIITPLIAILILNQKASKRTWISVVVATIGLALLSLHGWSIGTGELLILASAVAFACHIISLAKWSSGRDSYAFTLIQIATATLLTGLLSLKEGYQAPPDAKVWEVAIFCALIATVLAFFVQTWAQARISPTKVAVILTMEAVFAAFIAAIFGGETLTLRILLGWCTCSQRNVYDRVARSMREFLYAR